MVLLCLFDEVLEHEVQGWADTEDAPAVLRADVVQAKEVIEHLCVTVEHEVFYASEVYPIRRRYIDSFAGIC